MIFMRKDKLRVISGKNISLDSLESLKSVIGKSVISMNGETFGRIKDIVVIGDKISGIMVKNKSREVFIDIVCINNLFANSIMLKINPAFRVIGMKVYDKVGKKIGKVIDVKQVSGFTNAIDSLIIKKNIFSKPIYVKYSLVESDVKNILLKKEI